MKVLSQKNPYHLPKARRLELKYFCMQYPQWFAEYNDCLVIPGAIPERDRVIHSLDASTVEQISEKRAEQKFKMDLVISASKECSTDEMIGRYVFQGVTTGLSYDELWKRTEMPISRSSYYECLNKFFYVLDRLRR